MNVASRDDHARELLAIIRDTRSRNQERSAMNISAINIGRRSSKRLYGVPNDASTEKVAHRITSAYRTLIERSPFAALATVGPEGLDCSPRGDLPGFIHIHDDTTLMLPDRRGNNRIDSLRNIVRDPRVALMLLIPGSLNALRINGRAHHQRRRRAAGRRSASRARRRAA